MAIYPKQINEHFRNPFNAGELTTASAVGNAGSFICGAVVRLSLAIENGKITNARFKAAGCGVLIAAADMFCEQIKGQFIGQFDLTKTDVGKYLKNFIPPEPGLPAFKSHCAEPLFEAVKAAVNDFKRAEMESWNGDEALICTCFGVSERQIEKAIIENSLTTIESVTEICRAGGGCGSCQPLIEEILIDLERGGY